MNTKMRKSYKTHTLALFITIVSTLTCFGQWQNTGPYGARTMNGIQLGTDTFVTTFGNPGIYKSSDNGNNWSHIAEDMSGTNLFANGNSLYIVTFGVIYRSDDSGANWYAVSPQFPSILATHKIAFTDDYIFLFNDKKVYRSDNEGTEWSDWTDMPNIFTTQNVTINDVIIKNDVLYVGTVYPSAAVRGGFYRSEDFGATWTQINNGYGLHIAGGTFFNNRFPTVASMTVHNDIIFSVSSSISGAPQGIWKSDNNGDSWTLLTLSLDNANTRKITSINGSLYIGTENHGLYKSDDDGENWVQINDPDVPVFNHFLIKAIFEGNDNRIFAVSDNSVIVSDNAGANWEVSNNGIAEMEITSIVSGDTLFVGGNPGGIFRSFDNAETWENTIPLTAPAGTTPQRVEKLETLIVGNSVGGNFRFVSDDNGNTWNDLPSVGSITENNGYLFKAAIGDGVARSNDLGVTWEPVNNGLPDLDITLITSYGNKLYATLFSSGQVFQSVNNGNSWNSTGISGYPWGVSIVGTGNNVFIILPNSNPGIYRSLDNGENFTPIAPDGEILIFEDFILRKRFDSSSNTYQTFRSDDLGDTWQDVTGTFFNGNDYKITEGNGNLYAFSNNALYRSSNEGVNWQVINTPSTITITDLFVSNNKIFLRTFRQGLWHRNLDDFLPPNQPDEIFGATNICANSTQSYSVDELPDTTYNWQVPGDWTIVSGQGTSTIDVNVGTNSGVVSVTASNDFGVSPPQTLAISVSGTAPEQPSPIVGANLPCMESTQTYSVNNVFGVDYTWSVPSGWAIVAGQGTNSIEVTVGTDPGTIEVVPSNSCDSGMPQTVEVTVSEIPANPGEITGPENPEAGSIQFYNVADTPGVTYLWTVPSDWTIINGQGTHTVGVNVGNASGEITCTPSNDCGSGEATVLEVTTLGIAGLTSNNNITVYPNPSNGKVNISFNNLSGDTSVEIINMLGKKLSGSIFNINSNGQTQVYDLSHLSSGTYIIQINNSNKTYFKKLVIK